MSRKYTPTGLHARSAPGKDPSPFPQPTREFAKSLLDVTFVPVAGVYALISNGHIVYVGESVNVFSRPWDHRDKVFDSVKILAVALDPDKRFSLEGKWIHKLHPELNRTCPSCDFYKGVSVLKGRVMKEEGRQPERDELNSWLRNNSMYGGAA